MHEQSYQPQIWRTWYQQQSSRPHSRKDLITTTTTVTLSKEEFSATKINKIDNSHNYYHSKQGGIFCNHNQLNWLQPQLLSTPNKEELFATTLNWLQLQLLSTPYKEELIAIILLSTLRMKKLIAISTTIQPQTRRRWLQTQSYNYYKKFHELIVIKHTKAYNIMKNYRYMK